MKIIIANWKMNLTPEKVIEASKSLAKGETLWRGGEKEIVLCPSFESIIVAKSALENSGIKLGAQDCFWEDKGIYTGEVSPKILKSIGCEYVIVGHSERRRELRESDKDVNRKVAAAWRVGLTPIICVGETFEQRQNGQKDFVIMNQITLALEDLAWPSDGNLIIAYEPVWAIYPSQAVEPAEAEHVAMVIRQVLLDNFSAENAKKVKVIYGGSVNLDNVADFTLVSALDGFLVGNASLVAENFIELIKKV